MKEYPRKGLEGAGGALKKLFRRGPAPEPDVFRAVDGISFTVNRGESVGLVGESGCGKSTTSTMVMRLIDKSDGTIMFDGEDIGEIPAKKFARLAAAQAHPDGVPGPDRQPQSAVHRRARHCRPDPAARRVARPRRSAGALRGTGPSGRPAGRICSTAFRISFRAARRPASASRAPSRSSPNSSSSTSRPRRSTCRCRRSCSICLQELKELLGMSYLFVSHDLTWCGCCAIA